MKKLKYLILLAGSPGTGKTYLMNKLKEQWPAMYIVTPDEAKEYYAESIGFNSLEERQLQEKVKVWPFFYKALDLYMEAGKKVIVSEYPFSFKQKDTLAELALRYDYHVITIRLVANPETLWQRRYQRDRESDRHLSFIMRSYHYGDRLSDPMQATNHISKEEFFQIMEAREYDKFQLGELYEINVNDYKNVDYKPLLTYLKARVDQDKYN